MSKRIRCMLCLGMAVLMMLGTLACTANNIDNKDDSITIVCTIFPIYDWVSNLTKDMSNVEVKLLIDDGSDMHSYQPNMQDIAGILNADAVICVGGESDEWLYELLENNPGKDRVVISLLDVASDFIYEEEIVEGMLASEEEEETDEVEYDEHIWLSIKTAIIACERISDELCKLMPDQKVQIENNSIDYIKSLHNEDDKYKDLINTSDKRLMIVADRFPFRYLCEDYDIEYFAAFPGCSSDSNADFDTIIFLANKAKENSVTAIVTTESSATDISDSVIQASGMKLDKVVIDSMQSVTIKEINNGKTYLSVCDDNYESLCLLLNDGD